MPAEAYARNFCDAHPPLSPVQAQIEADRCYFCYDAPCIAACPTGINIPSFIRRIAEGNLRGAAHAILSANPLGGMCARVCPTEVLCEAACVRNTNEEKPVEIGLLQRFAHRCALRCARRAHVLPRGRHRQARRGGRRRAGRARLCAPPRATWPTR